MVLERSQVAGAEGRVRVGRREELPGTGDRGVLHGLVPVGARLVERRDQLGELLQPAETQIVGGRLEQLGRGEAAAEALGLDALGLE
jgi:hypothetical protein